MRIISGIFRGRQIEAPAGTGTRPTGDKVRGALFNILLGRIPGASVLDGFAGSGSLSFEALSRGAATATLFETDSAAAALLQTNITKLGIAEQCELHKQDFLLGAAALKGKAFDIVFLDPPYSAGLLEKALAVVDSMALVSVHGIVVAEHSYTVKLPDKIGTLTACDTRKYGITVLTFYQRQEHQ